MEFEELYLEANHTMIVITKFFGLMQPINIWNRWPECVKALLYKDMGLYKTEITKIMCEPLSCIVMGLSERIKQFNETYDATKLVEESKEIVQNALTNPIQSKKNLIRIINNLISEYNKSLDSSIKYRQIFAESPTIHRGEKLEMI